MKENVEVTEGRGSIVKCGEALFERGRVCENIMELFICDCPIKTFEYI